MIDVRDKPVAVVGMGKSGFAAVEVLLKEGARVTAIDSAPTPEMQARLAPLGVPLLEQCERAFSGAHLIVQSPGVPLETIPSTHVPVIAEVELAGYDLQGPTIGITGSNGKTTTTALAGHILSCCGIPCQVGGNIGTPPTAMIGSSRPGQWNVLELSSFQLETIYQFRARIAVCLNITQNHLDRHATMERYTAAKARLVETQDEDCFAVLNADNAAAAALAARTRAQVVWFGLSAMLEGDRIVMEGAELMRVSEVPLRGMHNVENVMAAAQSARLAGAAPAGIRDAVMSFGGVEHRIEFVRNRGGVDYYNDSKATSVDATLKAVDAFPGRLWIILGGKDKGSDYTPLREPLRAKAKAALLIGAAAGKIGAQLEGALECLPCGDLARAVEIAASKAGPGDTVLLAPACASFDQFSGFEHRGRVFKDLVRSL
jgi:UDP-N-acetylmuramoylalanine--D-glutamate ligase